MSTAISSRPAVPVRRRLPGHVLDALRLRTELARLLADRHNRGVAFPPAVACAHVLARLAVVTEKGGCHFFNILRLARRLGAPLPDERATMAEVHRASAEGERLGYAWRLPASDTLGVLLGVSEDERTRLSLLRIGSAEMTAAARRRHRDRKRKAATRQAAGIEPRPRGSHPWIALGISRATYFRAKNKGLIVMDDNVVRLDLINRETAKSASLKKEERDADAEVSCLCIQSEYIGDGLERMVRAVRAGVCTPAAIAEATEQPLTSVRTGLCLLVRRGQLARVTRGVYGLPAPEEPAGDNVAFPVTGGVGAKPPRSCAAAVESHPTINDPAQEASEVRALPGAGRRCARPDRVKEPAPFAPGLRHGGVAARALALVHPMGPEAEEALASLPVRAPHPAGAR